MSEPICAGDLVAMFVEECGVDTAFGVSSIHNLPILDAIARRNRTRFVPARGEAGAVNMADGYARIRGGIGVAITSTGPGAASAMGALLEAWNAGTPLLHITGQIDLPFLDRGRAYNHEAKNQLAMLEAVSKAAWRVWSADRLAGVLQKAAQLALTPPCGPVSVEIPIDVQRAPLAPCAPPRPLPVHPPLADAAGIAELAALASRARRPLLWLGGGARRAGPAVRRLAALGFGVVTSVNGRGVLAEDHPACLGAFNSGAAAEALYRGADFMLIAGSRLRGNETRNYAMALPRVLAQIDADAEARGRAYPVAAFVCGDAADALDRLAAGLAGRMAVEPQFAAEIARAKEDAVADLRRRIGPYAALADALRAEMPRDAVWARDVTIANSTWGNRYLPLYDVGCSLHALAGGIGQGVQMAIGGHFAAGNSRRVVALTGDGGLFVNVGELATAVQERAAIVIVVMNDHGYGVVRNIQDRNYGGRRHFVDIEAPALDRFAAAMGLHFARVRRVEEFGPAVAAALAAGRPAMVEVEMDAIGPYPVPFGGPPAGVQPSAG